MSNRRFKTHCVLASALYLLLFTVIVHQLGCLERAHSVISVHYDVEWSETAPHQMIVHAKITKPVQEKVIWKRIPLTSDTHRRGWIKPIEPEISENQYEFSVKTQNDSNTFTYVYSFLFSTADPVNRFQASQFGNGTVFIQPVDLFCVPENIIDDTVFSVRFINIPAGIAVHTGWKFDDEMFRVDYRELCNSFLMIGKARQHSLTIGKRSIRMVIEDAVPVHLDAVFTESTRKTTQELNRHFSQIGSGQAVCFFRQLDSTESQAMRRGDMIVIGVPRNETGSDEIKKKIAHELVHIYTDTVHNASWFEESVSEYLAWVTLVRSEQISPQSFLNVTAEKLVQSEHNEYDGTLEDALQARNGASGRNYVYSYGFLALLLLDAEIRSTKSYQSLDSFLENLLGSTETLLEDIDDLQDYLVSYSGPKVSDYLDRLAGNRLKIKPELNKLGLSVHIKGHTLLEVRNKSTGQYDRILESDEIVNINGYDVTSRTMKEVLVKLENRIVKVEVERNRQRVLLDMRIIPRYTISANDDYGSIWRRILNS